MTGGTPKEVHWTAEQQKRPQRTYRGRKRRETAAQGLDHWACFRPQNVVFVNPPKDSPEQLLQEMACLMSCSKVPAEDEGGFSIMKMDTSTSSSSKSVPAPSDGFTFGVFNLPCHKDQDR